MNSTLMWSRSERLWCCAHPPSSGHNLRVCVCIPRLDRRCWSPTLQVGLTRLGHSVSWVSRSAADPLGRAFSRPSRGEGIDVSRVEPLRRCTDRHHVHEEPGPGNTDSAYSTIDVNPPPQPCDSEPFESLQAKYLFVTGITPALSDSNRKLTFELVDKFRAAGYQDCVRPEHAFPALSADEADEVFSWNSARKSDVLIPSLVEAEILTGLKEGEAIAGQTTLSLDQLRLSLRAGDKGACVRRRAPNAASVLATRFQRSILSGAR